MRAARMARLDGPGAIEVVFGVPMPKPSAEELVIEVHAAGVSFPDLLQTRGGYQVRPEPPFTLGAEFAGRVLSTRAGSRFTVGQRVAGINGASVGPGGSGAFAELVTAVEPRLLPLPDSVTFEEGAALPLNLLTADFALNRRGRLEPGETVLVHGAGGGLGQTLVQLATVRGCRVIAVVSSAAKAAVARDAGATDIVPTEEFRQAVEELTEGRGVDLIADPVGGERFTDSVRSLARFGRILVLGFTGRDIPSVKVNRLLLKNATVLGVGWGEAVRADPSVIAEQWERLYPLISERKLIPPRLQLRPFADAPRAVASLDHREAVGKIVLVLR